jgi:thiol-disulfide isomerase/thioredoxin
MARRGLHATIPVLIVSAAVLVSGASAVRIHAAPQSDQVASFMATGEAAYRQRKYEEALAAFKKASDASGKSSVDAHLALSRTYLALGAFKNAIQSCDDALKFTGDNKVLEAAAHNQKGNALTAASEKPGDPKLKLAEAEYRAVLALTDTMPIATFNLGVTLLKLNRDDEGIHELQNYVSRGGNAPQLANARLLISEPRRARENFSPDFSVVTLEGEFVSLADLKGKTVLLDFWGTWCPPCRAATADLVDFYKNYGKKENFVMIGVAVDEASDQGWKDYIATNKMTWMEYNDKTHKLASAFDIHAFPTYIVIDREGIITGTKQGWGSDTMPWIRNEVNKALKPAK